MYFKCIDILEVITQYNIAISIIALFQNQNFFLLKFLNMFMELIYLKKNIKNANLF